MTVLFIKKDTSGFQSDVRIRIGSYTRLRKNLTNTLEPPLKKVGHMCQATALEKQYRSEGRAEEHVPGDREEWEPPHTHQTALWYEDLGISRH